MSICFWEDTWLGDSSLASQYPTLHNIVRHKDVFVGNVLPNRPLIHSSSYRGGGNGTTGYIFCGN
jgi:hypothetical protein